MHRYFKLEVKKDKQTKHLAFRESNLRESIVGPYQAINGRHSSSVVSYLCQKAISSDCALRTAEEEYYKDHALDIKFDSDGVLAACVTAESYFRVINFDDSATHSTMQEILRQRTLCPCKVVSWRPAATGDGTGEQTDIVCCPASAQHPIALYNLETCENNIPTLIIKRKEGWGFAEDALFLNYNLLCGGFRTGGRICLWDMRTRSLQREFQALSSCDELRCLCTPVSNAHGSGGNNGHEIMAASTSGALRLWDLRQTTRPLVDVNCVSSIPGPKHYRQLNAVEMSPCFPGVVAFTATDCVQRLAVGLFDIRRNKILSWAQNMYFDDTVNIFDDEFDDSNDGLRPVTNPGRAPRENRTDMIRDVLYNRGDVHFMPQQLCKKASLVCFSTPDGVTVARLQNALCTPEETGTASVSTEPYSSAVVSTFKLDFCRSVAVHPFVNTQMLCSSMKSGGISVIS